MQKYFTKTSQPRGSINELINYYGKNEELNELESQI